MCIRDRADCLKAAKEGEMTAEEKQNQAAVEELVQKFEMCIRDSDKGLPRDEC